jgi:NitT/TauT family transport system substrate-binding protein
MSRDKFNLLTLQEVMDILGVSRSTIDRWRKQKRMPYIKIGKEIFIDKEHLQKWLYLHNTVIASADNTPDPNSVITVGYQTGTAHMWSSLIIKELGLFEDELLSLTRYPDISVRWHNAYNGLELLEGMINGHIQIASLGDYPIVISQFLNHILPSFKSELLAFDGKTRYGQGIALILPKGRSLEELSQLYDLTISTVVNSSAWVRLEQLLGIIGNRNTTVIHQEMNESMNNILRRRIGASVMWEPYLSLVNFYKIGEIVFSEGLGDDYLTGIVADGNWLHQHASIVVAYLKAHLRAHKIIINEPETAAKIVSRHTGFPIEIVIRIFSRVRWDTALDRQDLQTLNKLANSHFNVQSDNSMNNYILANEEYLAAACKTGCK